jgi:hypothetical protein
VLCRADRPVYGKLAQDPVLSESGSLRQKVWTILRVSAEISLRLLFKHPPENRIHMLQMALHRKRFRPRLRAEPLPEVLPFLG